MNNNYYQSDIRTSRREDVLLSIDDDRQRLLGLIKYWREECFRYKKENETYENMRKEALKTIHETDDKPPKYYELKSDLLNILNKVGEDNETI